MKNKACPLPVPTDKVRRETMASPTVYHKVQNPAY